MLEFLSVEFCFVSKHDAQLLILQIFGHKLIHQGIHVADESVESILLRLLFFRNSFLLGGFSLGPLLLSFIFPLDFLLVSVVSGNVPLGLLLKLFPLLLLTCLDALCNC